MPNETRSEGGEPAEYSSDGAGSTPRLKREIDGLCGSLLVEEKYAVY